MTARVRVLVTDADSTKALAVVRALGATMDVLTTSPGRLPLAAWSRYTARHVRRPTRPATGLASTILALCRQHHVDAIITPEEASSFLLAREHERFEQANIRLTTAPVAALEIGMDKSRTLDAARSAGVSAPRTVALESHEAAFAAARELSYPLVIKPRFSNYWTGAEFIPTNGVSYANSDDDLRAVLARHDPALPPPLLQEFVPGIGLGIFLLIGADGSVLAEFAHERIRDLRPTGSGSVVRRSVPVNRALREAAVRLLRCIGWRGAAMVEFREDSRDRRPKLMEINGRLWGSLQLATDAGVNFPKLLLEDVLGIAQPQPGAGSNGRTDYRTDVVLRWWLGDLVRLARVLRGRPRGFAGTFPSRLTALRDFLGPQPPGTRQEILRWDDPLPALGEVVSVLSRRGAGER